MRKTFCLSFLTYRLFESVQAIETLVYGIRNLSLFTDEINIFSKINEIRNFKLKKLNSFQT